MTVFQDHFYGFFTGIQSLDHLNGCNKRLSKNRRNRTLNTPIIILDNHFPIIDLVILRFIATLYLVYPDLGFNQSNSCNLILRRSLFPPFSNTYVRNKVLLWAMQVITHHDYHIHLICSRSYVHLLFCSSFCTPVLDHYLKYHRIH